LLISDDLSLSNIQEFDNLESLKKKVEINEKNEISSDGSENIKSESDK
jgi:hypothetical protein